jgi:hypothetical protein
VLLPFLLAPGRRVEDLAADNGEQASSRRDGPLWSSVRRGWREAWVGGMLGSAVARLSGTASVRSLTSGRGRQAVSRSPD